jgi:23S rRNA (guanosine2251-2'-O)-methyltransferase
VALDAGEFPYDALDDLIEAAGTVLVLDHLQDPQNFGTLLRAAEAAGVAGVVIPQDRAVAVTPAVVNASAGAVEHLHVARVPNLPRALDLLKEGGRWVVGLDRRDDAVDLYAADLPTPVALVVGGEGSGISPNVARRCDLFVALPMRGRVASLNAATAGAIALFDLVRRGDGSSDADT